jgi:Lon protease-like protein
MAQIIEFESLQSALYFTRSIGKSRFNLLQSKQLENGLWVGDVEILNADVSIPIPAELEVMSTLLKDIISSLERQQSPGQMLPFSHPYNFNDCGWVANRLAELMPLSIAQKNHLLSQVNPRIRLDLVKEILEEINQNPGMHKPQKSI